jgi:hypothetical protein
MSAVRQSITLLTAATWPSDHVTVRLERHHANLGLLTALVTARGLVIHQLCVRHRSGCRTVRGHKAHCR